MRNFVFGVGQHSGKGLQEYFGKVQIRLVRANLKKSQTMRILDPY